MLPASLTDAALVAVAVAVLFMSAHWPSAVGAVTVALKAAPAARLPTLQFSVCAPTAPVTVQPAVTVPHVTPPPAGSGSLIATPVAVPGPLLVRTMLNVAVEPAVMTPASGVLAMASTGVWQVMLPVSLTESALLEFAVAVLFICVQAARLVGAV